MGNQAEEEEGEQTREEDDGMSQFVDHSGGVGRIRNAPLLELLAVSPGPYVVPPNTPPPVPTSLRALRPPRRYLGQEAGCLELEVGLTG